MTNNLPKVFSFTDLHLTENLKAIKEALSGIASLLRREAVFMLASYL